MNTQQLIEKIRKVDEVSISKLFNTYEKSFFSFAKKLAPVLSNEEIKEIYIDANYRLFKNVKDNLDFELTTPIKTYLFAIGKNIIYSTLKKKQAKWNRELELDNSLNDLINKIGMQIHDSSHKFLDDKYQIISIISDFVSRMAEPCKEILELRYFEEKRISEMVEILNDYSVKQSLSRKIHRCLESAGTALSKELTEAGFKFNERNGQWI